MAREFYGELRVRFGSVQGGIAIVSRRYSAMISAFRSVWREGLLIRRSWVRDPPGSSSTNSPIFPVAPRWRWGTLRGTSLQNQGGRYGSEAMRKRSDVPTYDAKPSPTVPDFLRNTWDCWEWA